jgi:hypothetical protein
MHTVVICQQLADAITVVSLRTGLRKAGGYQMGLISMQSQVSVYEVLGLPVNNK